MIGVIFINTLGFKIMRKMSILVLLVIFCFSSYRTIYANSDTINYDYDQCVSEYYSNFFDTSDGYNEKWYVLNNYHIEYADNGLK